MDSHDVVIAAPGKTSLIVRIPAGMASFETGPLVLSMGHILKGQVVDSEQHPIPGVTVAAQDWIAPNSLFEKTSRALTDPNGKFELPCVPNRDLAIICSKPGYSTRRVGPTSIASKLRVEMPLQAPELHVDPPPPLPRSIICNLHGSVHDTLGHAVANAKVWVSAHPLSDFPGCVPEGSLATDANGTFNIFRVPSEQCWLYAWHPDYTVSFPIPIDLTDKRTSSLEFPMSRGLTFAGRFLGMAGIGWYVRVEDINAHSIGDTLPNLPHLVPVNADGSFLVPRMTRGRFRIVLIIPSLDAVGDPLQQWVQTVTLPQQDPETIFDAAKYQPGFVEGIVRLSPPEHWRRLVVLAQEQAPPNQNGSWICPEPRLATLDANGRFNTSLRAGYYNFSVVDPMTGFRLHTWHGTVPVGPECSIERSIDLDIQSVPMLVCPPPNTAVHLEGFRIGHGNRPCPAFLNDRADCPRTCAALFAASGTFPLHGYWTDMLGNSHTIRDVIDFRSEDPKPIHINLDPTQDK